VGIVIDSYNNVGVILALEAGGGTPSAGAV